MSTGAVDAATSMPLFASLIDDAALFPPETRPMPEALRAHERHLAGPHSWLVGRFLCPASRLTELRSSLRGEDALELGLILDTGLTGLADALAVTYEDARLRLTAVEVPIGPDDQAAATHETLQALARLPEGVAAFIELPRVHGWRDALSLIAARGRGAKLRTGGLVAEAFPSDREVAEFIRACVRGGVTFKFTAGMHHAVRYRDERTGNEHHGFLNILAATNAAAARDATVSELTEIVGSRDPGDLVAVIGGLDAPAAHLTRRHFAGFGSCSVDEPVDDITGLGLIEKQAEG